ncbi:MAG: hypothetical protein ACR2HR_04960 [Euzebya sp.]
MSDTLATAMTRTDEHGVLILAPEEETVPEDSVHEETVDLLLAGLRGRYADVGRGQRRAPCPS